jgi:hypothetical protein
MHKCQMHTLQTLSMLSEPWKRTQGPATLSQTSDGNDGLLHFKKEPAAQQKWPMCQKLKPGVSLERLLPHTSNAKEK